MFAELKTDYDYDTTANVWFRRDQQSTFRYNDGDEIENRIYAIVQKSFDRSIASRELGANITDWASLYHLSPQRANLLRPLIGQITGPVLEIGCGCGAITRFLGESGLEVLALEGSARRAAITAERCRDLPNVQVLAEPFQDFQTTRKFKTITLIGVLEYARAFFAKGTERDPVDLMLERVVELLEPDGVLIVAIENQLGLKYFAGFKEDHLAKPMVGIEGQYNEQSVVTFGKRELGRRFKAAGLAEQQWWFPFPDYKLPMSVLSERAFEADVPADFSALISEACRSDAQAPAVPTFSLDLAWPAIARNGLCGELANSFLVMLSREQISATTTFGYHYGSPRKQAYAKVVEFKCEDGEFFVERKAVSDAVLGPDELHLDLTREPLQDGELWRHRLRNILLRDGWSMRDLELWSKVWWFTLLDKFDLDASGGTLTPSSLVPANALDALPRNLVVSESGAIHFIDQEWVAPKPIDLGYILYRGLSDALFGVDFCGKPAGDFSLKIGDLVIAVSHALEIPLSVQDLLGYFEQERQFQEQVVGRPVRMNPEAFLGRPLAQRVTYYDRFAAQQQLIANKDRQLKQLLDTCTETQQKLVSYMQSTQQKNAQHALLLAEKDEKIETLNAMIEDLFSSKEKFEASSL